MAKKDPLNNVILVKKIKNGSQWRPLSKQFCEIFDGTYAIAQRTVKEGKDNRRARNQRGR